MTLGSYSHCFPISLGWILSACSPTPLSDHCHPLSLAGAGGRRRVLGFVCMSGSISGHGVGHPHPRLAASWCIQRVTQSMQASGPVTTQVPTQGLKYPRVTHPPWLGMEGKAPGSISPPGHGTSVWWLAGGGAQQPGGNVRVPSPGQGPGHL